MHYTPSVTGPYETPPVHAGIQKGHRPRSDFLPIILSAHAAKREQEHPLKLSVEETKRLELAIDALAKRNVKNALIILENHGLIINVETRKVVTILNPERLKNGIVTDIDGAAYVR